MEYRRKGLPLGWLLIVMASLAPKVTRADQGVHHCRPLEARCKDLPDGLPTLPLPEAERWNARAAALILSAHAREHATWSKDSVAVVSALHFVLPRRYRQVPNKQIGDNVLNECGKERLLLVVDPHEVQKATGDQIITGFSISMFGATCDRKERIIFKHGIDFYRVIFGRGRPQVLLQSRLAL
jgi:hypothetical protein